MWNGRTHPDLILVLIKIDLELIVLSIDTTYCTELPSYTPFFLETVFKRKISYLKGMTIRIYTQAHKQIVNITLFITVKYTLVN